MLTLENVHVGYGRTTVVHGITLNVPKQSVVAVLGHNGAGKSTLLRAAVGLLRLQHGRVLIDGEDMTRCAPHERVSRGVAYVPQGQPSFGDLTAWENLQVVADGRKGAHGRIDEALDLFPALRGLLARRAGLLSGGQRQQLAIARALVTGPRLLVLDEPTEGIQPSVVKEIEDSVVELARGGSMSVLLVEQHVGFAVRACSRYLVLQSGEVKAVGAGGAASITAVRSALAI